MPRPLLGRYTPLLALVSMGAALGTAGLGAPGRGTLVRLRGHVPNSAFIARKLSAVDANETIHLAITLPLRNEAELNQLLGQLYQPGNAQYGRYLSTDEFQARFSPTETQYTAVAEFARGQGLTVTGTHPNRLLLDLEGPAAAVERAFSTRLSRFQAKDGRVFRAPEVEPGLPAQFESMVSGVVGLDDLAVRHPHLRKQVAGARFSSHAAPRASGSGPNGGLSPSDIKTAYSLSGSSLDGSGETMALFELDGYNTTDITKYEDQFGLPHVPLQNVLVDSYSGAAGSGADEVTLDIELQIALAPGASKIMVYEGPNSDQGALDIYNQIATDNVARSISTSWGLTESENTTSFLYSENSIFKEMAAQGQSIFAAAGDSGAYDDGRTLGVDDPASQPYVTSAGGTQLTTTGAGGSWKSETTWNDGSATAGAGGGGISGFWSQPSYQSGVASTASKGSTTMRNVPDVAMNAAPNTGYAIYYGGQWVVYGGTSCASPIWAAFAALINQQRTSSGQAPLGFANPQLYALGKSKGTTDFHDIADSSTNLYYPAVSGYDLATGWGSFNGGNLLADLGTATSTYSISGTITLSSGGGLSGVTVSAGGKTATTSSGGSYTISGLTGGTYTVIPTLAGYTFSPSQRSVTVGPDATGVDFTASGNTYSISGTVTLNGAGLAGVTVSAGGVSATTGANGTYTISGVVAGTYTVTPTLYGYSFTPTSRTVTVGPAQTGVDFTATKLPTYTISGTVTESGGGLAGVTVSAGGFSTTTGADGAYTLSGLVAGTYSVVPTKASYSFTPGSRSVTIGPDATGVDFTGTQTSFTISGVVTLNGVGLSGVTITTRGRSVTSGGNGSYSLTGLAAGTYTVTATKNGYAFTPATQEVTIGPNQSGINFTAATGTYTISGTVTASGSGLSGVTVTAGAASAVTSNDGTYAISGLAAGTYTVSASQSGSTFSPVSRQVTVGPDATGVNFALAKSYQLSGRVAVGGAGLANVEVQLTSASNVTHSAVTDSAGNYTVTNLAAGTYSVKPSLAAYTFFPATRSVTLTQNLANVNFAASQVATLSSLSFAPAVVVGGKSAKGTIQLSIAATADTNVSVFTSSSGLVKVPASVLVRKGRSSATFTATTLKVSSNTQVTIQAYVGSNTHSATLTLRPKK